MNKNKIAGIVLVATAAVLVGLCVTVQDSLVTRCVGKAVWFVPYATLVAGLSRLAGRD